MADNRYRSYLEHPPSSHFSQREHDSEERRQRAKTGTAVGIGLGIAAIGAVAYAGGFSKLASHVAGKAGQYRGTYVRSISEGVKDWARHPADLHHGMRMMLRGQLDEGIEMLDRSAIALRASVNEARERLTREASERLHGLPSDFEREFARLMRNDIANREKAAGYARRALATELIDRHMVAGAQDPARAQALSRIAGVVENLRADTMQGLTRSRWHHAIERSLGRQHNSDLAEEVWSTVIEPYVARNEIVDGVVRPVFVNAQERAAIRAARQNNRQLSPLLQALQSAEREYHRVSNLNYSLDYKEFIDKLTIDPKKELAFQRMTGLRHATVDDLLSRGQIGSVTVNRRAVVGQDLQSAIDVEDVLRNSRRKRIQGMRQLAAGKGLYINQQDELIDLRAWRASMSGLLDFAAYETGLPIVKFNPLQLFHYSSMRQAGEYAGTHFIQAGTRQYSLRNTADRTRAVMPTDAVLRNNKVYDFLTGQDMSKSSQWYAMSTRYGTQINMYSDMIGPRRDPRPRPTGTIGGMFYDIGQALDIGNQDMPSAWTKLRSIFTKFDDPSWARNNINAILQGITNEDQLHEFDIRLDRLSRFARQHTAAYSDDTFRAIVNATPEAADIYGRMFAQYDLSDADSVIDSVARFIQDRTSSMGDYAGDLMSLQYRYDILREWNAYTYDPDAYMRSLYISDNKAPVKLLSESITSTRRDRIKRLIQNEIIASIQEESGANIDIAGAVSAAYDSGAIAAEEAMQAQFTALGFAADSIRISMSAEPEDVTISRINQFVDANRDVMERFGARKSPMWQINASISPNRQLIAERGRGDDWQDTVYTDAILIQRARPFPIKELVRAFTHGESQEFGQALGVFARQFGAGRDNMGDVTTATFVPYFFGYRLNSAIANPGLAMGSKHLGSAADIYKGLFATRYLPAYAALALGGGGILGYLNWEIGQVTGMRPSEFGAGMLKEAHLSLVGMRDKLGVTGLGKSMERYMPGSEMIWELPVLSAFDPTESREEVQEDYRYGYEPVRKGRYWPLGNTPFVGGRVMYYQPNWYRRARHDIAHTDVLYGSGEEHYSHVPFPTFRNPLAPLNYIFDPYWLERKHYWDRPYPMTSGVSEIEDIPIVGSFLNQTVGQLIKPRRYMHRSELPPPYGTSTAGDIVHNINEYEKARARDKQAYLKITPSGGMEAVAWQPAEGVRSRREPTQRQLRRYLNDESGSSSGARLVAAANKYEKQKAASKREDGDLPQYYISSGERGWSPLSSSSDRGSTGAGKAHIAAANEEIKRRAVPRRGTQMPAGRLAPISMGFYDENAPDSTELPEGMIAPGELGYEFGKAYYGLTQMGGIYGFGTTLAFGEPYSKRPVLASSTRMTTSERAFYDLEIGGLGGDLSEIGRRFIPHRQRQQEFYSPIRNTMPSWMPGPSYFKDFQHGDQYSSLPKGEMRLPGAGYELMHDVPGVRLRMAASSVGKDVDAMVEYLIKQKEPLSEYGEYVTDIGDKFHKYYERLWMRRGILRKENIERETYDEQHNIKGYIDAILDTPYGPEITDVKSMSGKRFMEAMQTGQPYQEHVEQVNFYMHATGIRHGGLMYVNRDDPKQEAYFQFEYSDKMFRRSLRRIEEARDIVRGMIKRGDVNKFDLYDDLNRFRILADVAPWSQEYKFYASQVTKDERLTAREKAEIQATKKRVSEVKKAHRLFPYQFIDAEIERKTVTVDRVLDNQRFTAREYPNEVFSLAGVFVPTGRTNELAGFANEVISQVIRPGRRVRIGIDADPVYQHKSDVVRSIPAVVYDRRGRNLNRDLIDMGLAAEKETDISPAGVHARFTKAEIARGKMWERFVHLNTPIHSKLLQVRSPLEDYERREVYGKNWQEWEHPIRDYIQPTLESFATYNPIVAAALGGIVGSMFGHGNRAPWILGGIGAAIGGGASLMRAASEAATGGTWVPRRRERERDINKYFDILKYVKAKGLYEYSLRQAEAYDDKRPAEKFDRIKEFGRYRKARVRQLKSEKRYLMRDDKHGNQERISAINREIEAISSYRGITPMNPWELQAFHYKRQMETTLYGADPRGSVRDFIIALPKKDREYATAFLKHSSPEERKRILEVVPENQRPFYQAHWGMKPDDKPDLKKYFKDHFLPPPDWEGWRPEKSLDDVKVKVIRNEGAEMAEFGFWPDDVKRAETNQAPALPMFNPQVQGFKLKQLLEATLKGEGLQNINVMVVPTNKPGIAVDLDLERDRKEELEEYVRLNGVHI